MRTHIVFVICTGEHLAMHHREQELMRRAESLGVVLTPRHPDESSDIPRPRVNVGTIGHVDWGRSAIALALVNSSRFVLPLSELKIEAAPYQKGNNGYQFAKLKRQHEEDFQRKSRQLLRPTRNFCCRRR